MPQVVIISVDTTYYHKQTKYKRITPRVIPSWFSFRDRSHLWAPPLGGRPALPSTERGAKGADVTVSGVSVI